MGETTVPANPTVSFLRYSMLVPLAWAGPAVLTRDCYQWQRGRTHLDRFCHETWETQRADVLLNTNLSPKVFILLLSLKYVKLRAVVVLIIINMPSSLVRGWQHIFIFSSHINSIWWKAIQIIKCVFILLCFNLCRRIGRFSGSSNSSELEASRFSPQHQPWDKIK